MSVLLDQYIETHPGVRNGKPCIAGTRFTVADLAIKHLHLGEPLEEIARKYSLPLAAVYAGMAYYYTHREEIDARIAAADAFAEAFRREHPERVIVLPDEG